MSKITEDLKKEWDKRDGAVVFSTVDAAGAPNSIYATCVGIYEDNKVIVANNYFDKTMKNIKAGGKASVLFITDEKKSYQIKGTLEYFTTGPVFDFMKSWNPKEHPGHGAAAIKIESIYSGAQKLV